MGRSGDLVEHVRTELERLTAQAPKLELKRVLIAVSGGLDSVTLLALLKETGLDVSVAHLDHGIRAESNEDAAFVQALCADLNLTCILERVNIPQIAVQRGWGLEEAARKIRYEFLARAAKRCGSSAILTAHTTDDNAETVLMQLLRGTVRASGIPPRRERILRPLLRVSRAELHQYAITHDLRWCQDASNSDTRFSRNWIRHQVLPLLETRHPNVHRKLAEHANLMRDEDALLEAWAARVPNWTNWQHEPIVMQRRLIRRSLEAGGIVPDLEHIETIREALNAPNVMRVSLPQNKTAVIQNGGLHIFAPAAKTPNLEWPECDFSDFPWAKLRTREPGDRIRLPGGTRKLSDVLIDKKISREVRDQIPLVAQNSEVLWIGLEPPLLDVRIGMTTDHEYEAMNEALTLAREAFNAGEVPVGAVVIQAEAIIGRGRNRSRQGYDMTLHAELEAIRDACRKLQTAHLTDCTLVVTLEPCLMCLGAVLESRIRKVVFAARNSKNGALGGVIDASRANWTHRFQVRSGLLETESAGLLEAFFAQVRSRTET